MLFQKPSLRTRVSLETGMTQLGGHAIYYPLENSPFGKKESISDTAKVLSRMVDIITIRISSRNEVRELAANATVPVINTLDDYAHPCQMLADLQV
jgi:ornithine carbamoyltransferase